MSNETTNAITFNEELVERLNAATATANGAVAEAACAAVAQDKKVTVRAFATALRTAAPALGTNNAVLAAAVKAAKIDKATAVDVAEAMACAIAKKRADDARRAAKKRADAPQKALEKAELEVEACKRALWTPLQKATAALAESEQAVRAAAAALRTSRAARRAARAELAKAEKAAAEKAAAEKAAAEKAAAEKAAAEKAA